MALIQQQSLLYHLTCMDNLPSILDSGLRSRQDLGRGFTDIADGEIIQGRGIHNLQAMVPFHFFANNPFDGRVKADHPDKSFCMITVPRVFARNNGWKIIPRHPLAVVQGVVPMDYDEGFEKIDWASMNLRDYKNSQCKSVCMAECLSPTTVYVKDFQCIFVRDEAAKKHVEGLLKARDLSKFVNINHVMC
ncbi:DarT ssDNA thymidine ADP-ribosyltransferase family protein [Siccibacter turicensis]|uniref:DUF4433 domain-containing protein n=1 Tax=Siccibacter turicensis TaxID=357233 RepID=A0A2P8VGW4_9ENTR|nr:DarT ssDNA thymidine ADP-ribosyltransferase family protein [Siccibacter turicensis]PSN06754.1 DUF4433 domain-containing protein [Siccibacter turicensis]